MWTKLMNEIVSDASEEETQGVFPSIAIWQNGNNGPPGMILYLVTTLWTSCAK